MFAAEVKKAGSRLSFSQADSGTPRPGPAKRGEKEKGSTIKKSGRSRPPVLAQEDSDSEEEIEASPPVTKRSKRSRAAAEEKGKPAGKKPRKVVQADQDSEEDMFSPSPKKRLKGQDTGVQTSPAFVAASKAARVGKKAIDQSEYVNGTEQHITPSKMRKTSKTSEASKVKQRKPVKRGKPVK